ncbi:sulfatase-like hydrolase/transferase [Rufibacter sp. LB8]|uniref:sulfatase-like hydrolase/transferase n=1 Tax=Rufibacter sp. LB8 TaxID=2777781 RepID=UPI00178C52D8|nr:sulfatase-like hydrolase/transferase [Rufibacter sp. LB8]
MRQRFSPWIPLFLLGALALYVATVEMRPGRLYFLLNYLLFQDSLTSLLLYLLTFAVSIGSLLLLWFNQSRKLFIGFLALLIPSLTISFAYRLVTGYNFMYSDAVLAWNNLALASTAVLNYSSSLFLALAGAAFIVFILLKVRNHVKWRSAPSTAFIFFLSALGAFAFIKTSTGVVDDFPAMYRVPLTLAVAVSDRVPQPQREQVTIQPIAEGVPHLFLIVDESITATELTLYNPGLATTPFLASIQEQLKDFGISRAFTNQSGGSNLALYSGAQLSDLPDKAFSLLSRSTIFQFAKKAGYTTYYIDAQLNDGLQNFMSPEDLKYIDHVERPAGAHPNAPYYQRDILVAERLTQLAKHPSKVFAYVVKAGAHWPYGQTYPTDSTFFMPALASRSFYKDPERTLNTYHNALRWTVDEFWRKVTQGISPQDSTVIVYTSDHGQNLSQAGISLTHASVHETSPQEAAVPLWIWDPAQLAPSTASKALIARTVFSHAHIFPSLLQLQGYAPSWVRKNYGPSLLDTLPSTSGANVFLAGDIFGRGPHSLIPFYPSKAN